VLDETLYWITQNEEDPLIAAKPYARGAYINGEWVLELWHPGGQPTDDPGPSTLRVQIDRRASQFTQSSSAVIEMSGQFMIPSGYTKAEGNRTLAQQHDIIGEPQSGAGPIASIRLNTEDKIVLRDATDKDAQYISLTTDDVFQHDRWYPYYLKFQLDGKGAFTVPVLGTVKGYWLFEGNYYQTNPNPSEDYYERSKHTISNYANFMTDGVGGYHPVEEFKVLYKDIEIKEDGVVVP